MRLYEVAKFPIQVGVQPVKWFGGLVINQATQAARSNIVEIWRLPWEREVSEHLVDARSQRDFPRAAEQRDLQTCIERFAPQTADDLEALASQAGDQPDLNEIDDVLGPFAPTDPNA